MKVKKFDGGQERQILIAMIVSKRVAGAIASRWTSDMFSTRPGNIIGGWVVNYFQKYRKAPGKDIIPIFDSWASSRQAKDKELVTKIETILGSLSSEYSRLKKSVNEEYMIDLAGAYFNRVRAKNTANQILAAVGEGEVEEAMKLYNEFHNVELGTGTGISLLRDESAVTAAFEEPKVSIVKYGGAMGEFIGSAFERDGLIAFMGPEKSGKTWMLIDVAWMTILQKLKVAFFEVGDMSQRQVIRRFGVRACRMPMTPGMIRKPISLMTGPPLSVVFEEKKYEGATEGKVRQAFSKISSNLTPDCFRLYCDKNNTVTVSKIENVIEGWEREGWLPDVVVIDYADILAPMNGTAETRDQINATWKQLRALSQGIHGLVVTATQTNALSYKAEIVDKSNFSEDKRKLAHATGVIVINQNNEEMELGVRRLNWVVVREQEFSVSKCVYVAGCLALGRPIMLASF